MKYSLSLFICLFAFTLSAQNLSWKKHAKIADKLFEQGKYADAAEHYQAAWKKKPSKKNLIYKAGDCFYELKDFRKAAETYKRIKDESGDVGLAGLKYARALKQDGQYELAKKELLSYNKKYKGEDKKVVSKLVFNELAGCDMGLAIEDEVNQSIVIEHLSESINTLENEFAPIPFSDDILYFTSTMAGDAKMYRSQRQSGVWTQAVVPDLPNVTSGQICHGSFSPDNQRFYFTICQTNGTWKGTKSNCDIYVTRTENGSWSEPEKLRDYIRMEGSTATHPFVVHTEKEEILYFTSDREGGFGGLDIWYTKRQLASDDVDFTLPKNAGPRINTLGDEVTPFYNVREETLYFSSNGHVTLGGFDIFKAKSLGKRFDKPEHLGLPLNSCNDDYYYIEEKNGAGGFLVSNRLFGLEKINTIENDIFVFATPSTQIMATGNIIGKNDEKLSGVNVNLYEVKNSTKNRLLTTRVVENGAYQFVLLPNTEYRLTVMKDGYKSEEKRFSTFDDEKSNYPVDFQLSELGAIANNNAGSSPPVFTDPNAGRSTTTTKPSTSTTPSNTNTGTTYANSNTTPTVIIDTRPTPPPPVKYKPKPKVKNTTTTTPTHSGTYYKVQLTVVLKYNPNQSMFREVKSMGRLDTEYMAEKDWYRVLVGDFFSLKEARDNMLQAQQYGFFDAFLVKYRNGRRVTP